MPRWRKKRVGGANTETLTIAAVCPEKERTMGTKHPHDEGVRREGEAGRVRGRKK